MGISTDYSDIPPMIGSTFEGLKCRRSVTECELTAFMMCEFGRFASTECPRMKLGLCLYSLASLDYKNLSSANVVSPTSVALGACSILDLSIEMYPAIKL